MKNDETGEFELVLGNRQLLSAFFIVVILFAVFFTMGYIVGRNSAPGPKIAASTEPAPVGTAPEAAQTETRPQPGGAAETPPAAASQPPTETPASSGAPAGAAPQPMTQPVQETPAAKPDGPPATAPAPEEPEAGQTYLQVMAVKRPDAEVVARTLREKGFATTLAPARDDLVRVLVGPYADATSLGKAKAALENAGFHPIVRK
ncbi:MAG TPA: SPOR domain-containing protein [Bryobacteraceae bacterium]|nr:SPOR domain-containing protein [Bryobacteraceae bacterium]